jgi:hypothetical protein
MRHREGEVKERETGSEAYGRYSIKMFVRTELSPPYVVSHCMGFNLVRSFAHEADCEPAFLEVFKTFIIFTIFHIFVYINIFLK